jgi:hypothetical protein
MRAAAIALLLAACSEHRADPLPLAPGAGGAGGAEPIAGAWVELPPLLAPRSAIAAARIGRALYLAGGLVNGDLGSRTLARYPLDAPGEQPFAELALPTAGALAFASEEDFVVAGGVAGLAEALVVPHERCERYELLSGFLIPCAGVGNGPTSHAAVTMAAGVGYVFGGLRLIDSAQGTFPTKVAQRFDTASGTWSAETMMPAFRDGAAAFVHDGAVHLVGGRTLDEQTGAVVFLTEAWSYDLAEHAWAVDRLPPLPTPRAGLACAAALGHVYCAGGYDAAGTVLATVERLDLAAGAWEPFTPLPQPLRSLAAVADERAIIVLGGRDAAAAPVAAVYRLE